MHDDPRDMTTGEADAWRAARDAAAKLVAMEGIAATSQMQDAEPDSPDMVYNQGRADAASRLHAAIRAMQPPERASKGETE